MSLTFDRNPLPEMTSSSGAVPETARRYVVERVPALSERAGHVKQLVRDKLVEHKRYIAAHGIDMPEVRNWRWSAQNRLPSDEA
jgi:hypothetical protein